MEKVADSAQTLQVTVNRAKCSGYGICADMCPSVFKLDAGGFATVTGPVPLSLEAEVRETAYECPEEAITVQIVSAAQGE